MPNRGGVEGRVARALHVEVARDVNGAVEANGQRAVKGSADGEGIGNNKRTCDPNFAAAVQISA